MMHKLQQLLLSVDAIGLSALIMMFDIPWHCTLDSFTLSLCTDDSANVLLLI